MVIYKITNKVSKKIYIGKTEQSLKRRRFQHYYSAKRGTDTKLYRALRKYKEEDFIWEIVAEGKDQNELNALEVKLIKEHDSYKTGYNMTLGGDGGDTISMKTPSEKKKQGSFYKGQKAWNEGLDMKKLGYDFYKDRKPREWTDEQRKAVSVRVKNSEVHQEAYKTRVHGMAIAIKDSLGNTFQYKKDLAQHLGLSLHLTKKVIEAGEYKGVKYTKI